MSLALGFVILAGVVVNNSILIVHQTLNFLKDPTRGLETPDEAIAASVETRVRPILMSALTSVGGMIPLVLLPGSGSELYRGLGSVVLGGLMFSTLFTLILVPKDERDRLAFDYLDELRDALRTAANEAPSFPDRFEAEVWLTDMSQRLARQVRDPQERIRILTLVHLEATRVKLPPELILAVIEVESNFDRYAISVAGAIGLMQIMPFWLDEIGRPNDNLLHIDTNLRYGCTILRFYYDKEQGDLRRALGRYNGSLGKRKYPNKVIDKLSRKWFQA